MRKYVNTDQEYVLKLVRQNVGENTDHFVNNISTPSIKTRNTKRNSKAPTMRKSDDAVGNVFIRPLDWETSDLASLYKDLDVDHLDLVISCDCIYNEALVEPLATTMRDICQLASENSRPTVVVVAQQLRSPDVLEAWFNAFCKYFHVYRIPDIELDEGLREDSGYTVHVGIVR